MSSGLHDLERGMRRPVLLFGISVGRMVNFAVPAADLRLLVMTFDAKALR